MSNSPQDILDLLTMSNSPQDILDLLTMSNLPEDMWDYGLNTETSGKNWYANGKPHRSYEATWTDVAIIVGFGLTAASVAGVFVAIEHYTGFKLQF